MGGVADADSDEVVAELRWDELRFSVSWKAYCFEDEHEQRTWREHADDLTLEVVVDRLVADLRERGRIDGDVPGNPDLGLLIIDEYIEFPHRADARCCRTHEVGWRTYRPRSR